jgi:hypothetical protein
MSSLQQVEVRKHFRGSQGVSRTAAKYIMLQNRIPTRDTATTTIPMASEARKHVLGNERVERTLALVGC